MHQLAASAKKSAAGEYVCELESRYGIALEIADKSLPLFDAQAALHGV